MYSTSLPLGHGNNVTQYKIKFSAHACAVTEGTLVVLSVNQFNTHVKAKKTNGRFHLKQELRGGIACGWRMRSGGSPYNNNCSIQWGMGATARPAGVSDELLPTANAAVAIEVNNDDVGLGTEIHSIIIRRSCNDVL